MPRGFEIDPKVRTVGTVDGNGVIRDEKGRIIAKYKRRHVVGGIAMQDDRLLFFRRRLEWRKK